MSYRITYSEKAISDITHTREYYKIHDLEIEQKFKLELEKIATRLRETPEVFQETGKNQRRAILGSSFPYSVYYSINLKEKSVAILGVIHQSKNLDLVKQKIKLEKLHTIRREKELRIKQRMKELEQLEKKKELEQDHDLDRSRFRDR